MLEIVEATAIDGQPGSSSRPGTVHHEPTALSEVFAPAPAPAARPVAMAQSAVSPTPTQAASKEGDDFESGRAAYRESWEKDRKRMARGA
jgi:hypothetical protein